MRINFSINYDKSKRYEIVFRLFESCIFAFFIFIIYLSKYSVIFSLLIILFKNNINFEISKKIIIFMNFCIYINQINFINIYQNI